MAQWAEYGLLSCFFDSLEDSTYLTTIRIIISFSNFFFSKNTAKFKNNNRQKFALYRIFEMPSLGPGCREFESRHSDQGAKLLRSFAPCHSVLAQ